MVLLATKISHHGNLRGQCKDCVSKARMREGLSTLFPWRAELVPEYSPLVVEGGGHRAAGRRDREWSSCEGHR